MKFINFLQIIQFFVTFAASTYTPVDKCIYGFFAFAIGFTYALLNLSMSRRNQKRKEICKEKEKSIIEQQQSPKESKVLTALESAHDYIPIGFINIEVHHVSSQVSKLSFMFCIPFALDILSRLFDDGNTYIADENMLVFLKTVNILMHALSMLSLAAYQYNIWFVGICLSAMIIICGVYSESSYSSAWKNLKLFGYILFYIFAFIGIYDVDFIKRLEWFKMQVSTLIK